LIFLFVYLFASFLSIIVKNSSLFFKEQGLAAHQNRGILLYSWHMY